VRRLVSADVVDSRLDEVADAVLDLVADLAHTLEWLPGRIVDVPVLDL
jgi:hypothetical protein